jgi:protein-S-isoprenylcysteine O-methyltransferase Ste14
MLLAAIGIALTIPNALAVALLAASFVALSVQVRMEEAYLEGWLGAEYAAYTGRTGRWISLP